MILTKESDTNTNSFFKEFEIDKMTFGTELDFEKANFLKKKLELLQNPEFIGKYVAVIKGKVVDKDDDKFVLLNRIYKQYGYTSILIEKISTEIEECFTSPNFEL